MAARGKTTLRADPHRHGAKDRKEGRGDPDQEPVGKGRPDERVKGHAVKVEREGRPAEGAGDASLAEPKDPDAR